MDLDTFTSSVSKESKLADLEEESILVFSRYDLSYGNNLKE